VELIGNPQLSDDTQLRAASSLGKIDPGNQKAIDALVELIGNPQLNNSTRRQAVVSLGQIGSRTKK
jgi:HEAT repeat protein